VIELVPESYLDRLDPQKVFRRTAPLQVDLGCGDGAFLCALAKRMPEKNFLGLERLVHRVRSAVRKATRLDNVRVLRIETFYAIRYLLPTNSVEAFHLLFPDPWPKRRHHRRRIVTADFLKAAAAALTENGTLRIATDQSEYFEQICRCAEQSADVAISKENGHDDFPASAFENRFKRAGAQIYLLELRKVSPVT
jgi:tRNA (guanine-N7-)-methyltransferase